MWGDAQAPRLSGKIPRFRFDRAPPAIDPRREFLRPAAYERGLDERWRRLSIRFRKQNPFCRMCEQVGNDAELVAVVDHILPRREHPELTYVWKNLQGLCRHHDNLKQAMEAYARKHGLVEKLPDWCADPAQRPAQFKTGLEQEQRR